MAYEKTNWVNGETPISAENLNKMEQGIEDASKSGGNVVDTFDVEDKTTNAPSVRAVEEKFKITSYELTNLPEHIGGTNGYMLKKTGNIVVFAVDNIWVNSIKANTWIDLGYLPTEIRPNVNIQTIVIASDSANGNVVAYGKGSIGLNGLVRCKVNNSNNNLSSFTFDTSWIV